MRDPRALGLYALAAETKDFSSPNSGVNTGGNTRELLLTRGQPAITRGQNLRADTGIDEVEKADAQMKGVLGRGFLLGEMGETAEEFLLALGGKGVQFAGLAALAWDLSLADPAVFDEAVKERVNEIVVHLASAGDQGDLFFEGVAVLGAGEEGGEED